MRFAEIKARNQANASLMAGCDQFIKNVTRIREVFIYVMKGDFRFIPCIDTTNIDHERIRMHLLRIPCHFFWIHSWRILYL